MPPRLHEYRLFFGEFLKNFHTTGAVLPSGRFLGAALARFVAAGTSGPGRRILEVGPGTGAVTGRIIPKLAADDRLDLVELNDRFVARLRDRFQSDPAFLAVAERARVLHCPVEDLPRDEPYDLIVSGLPLNNFSVAAVEQILAALAALLKPGGTLSFFEYLAVRRLRSRIGPRGQRQRMQGISRALAGLLDDHEIRRDLVWPNVPPACVHHVRM